MAGVECRTLQQNEVGAAHYARLLEQWKPGPVLVHQTYANLLDELERYDEALDQRHLAVQMEPAAWSYDGLGNTLTHLRRFDEANEAHARAVKLNPSNALYWRNWGWNSLEARRYSDAMLKFQKAATLDPKDYVALTDWGICLANMHELPAAVQKFDQALAISPSYRPARLCREELESRAPWVPVPQKKQSEAF
jgi:tetratricopeptide (TPR) repeat protein